MIIQPQFPTGFVIFCDDFREELGGKNTIVGTYGGEMTVFGVTPTYVPMLSVIVRYRDDPTTFPKLITFKISKETKSRKEVLVESTINAPALPSEFEFPETTEPESKKFIEIQFVAKLAALEITEQCDLRVRAYVGDDEVRLGTLVIKLAPPPENPPN